MHVILLLAAAVCGNVSAHRELVGGWSVARKSTRPQSSTEDSESGEQQWSHVFNSVTGSVRTVHGMVRPSAYR